MFITVQNIYGTNVSININSIICIEERKRPHFNSDTTVIVLHDKYHVETNMSLSDLEHAISEAVRK